MEEGNQMFEEKDTNIFDLYQDEELVEDERFGKITIMRTIKPENIAYEKIFKVERVIVGADQLALCEQQVVTRLSLENENIIEMLDYCYTFLDDNYEEFHFVGFYELPDTDLQREIMYRSRTGKNFTDLEIFNMIKDISNALYYLQVHKLMHGDLRYVSVLFPK
jgi:serine/threonine protein kinase